MDILYYSNNCGHCQKLLAYLAKNALIDKYNFVNIDRRTVDPYTNQIHVILDRGTKVSLPPNVTRVPTLVLVNKKHQTVVGEEIYAHLEPTVARGYKMAVGENGEPSGFVLASSSGGVNIVSETFTMYDASPEELLAKGTGSMRQMHNYASANNEFGYIQTPMEDASVENSRMRAPSSLVTPGQPSVMHAPSVMSGQPSVMSGTPSVMSGQHSVMSGQPSVMHAPSVMSGTPSVMSGTPQANHSIPSQRLSAISMTDNGNPGALTSRTHSTAAKYDTYALPAEGLFYRAGQIVVPELQRPPAHRHEKLGEDVTIESLQQKRNEELQFSMPPMAQQLNQAVIPEVANVYPPSSQFNRATPASNFQPLVGGGGYFANPPPPQNKGMMSQPAFQNVNSDAWNSQQSYAPKLSSEDAREMLFGKRQDDKGAPAALSAPYLVNI